MSVKATSRVSQVLAAADLQRLGQNTINKLARAVRTDVIDRTSKQYNLSRRVLGEFVYIKRASRGNLSASINLRIRAVPLDRFGARVRMKTVRGVDAAGRKLDRKLPSVRVRIYRQGSAKDLPGAFPLYQRMPCARHDERSCRHPDCGHYIPLDGRILCFKISDLVKPWIKAGDNLSKVRIVQPLPFLPPVSTTDKRKEGLSVSLN